VSRTERELPIAVFDSGVGGLTVLHECLVSLPNEDYVYLGDTARFPYGDRSHEQLRVYSLELGDRLVDQGAKLLVVACNSATAAALPELRERLAGRVPVVSVVTPESRLAARATRNGRVGLLATPATVASGAYERALAETAPGATLHAVAAPDLAPLIQEGGEVDERVVASVERSCEPLRRAGTDTVILGCTHYPLVRPLIQRTLGRDVSIVTSGEAIAGEVERELLARGIENDRHRRGRYRFLSTGDPEAFRRLGTRFLQLPLNEVHGFDVASTAELRVRIGDGPSRTSQPAAAGSGDASVGGAAGGARPS
jgi:glutamate racemase